MRLCAAPLIACAIASPVFAGFTPYSNTFRTVSAPPVGAGSFGVAGAALADGRLLAMTGSEFYVETGVGTGLFTLGATLDASISNGSDPGFLSVSPGGSTIALGAGFNRPVVTFDAALLDGTSTINATNASVFNIDHFAGAWSDGDTLVVSGQAGVTAINTVSGASSVIVSNFDGASAGVAFDSAGNLYTGNGFDFAPGGTETGEIRRFVPSDWAGAPADFQTDGAFVADVLSASPLHIDANGYLVVGGGDFSGGDSGYVGVLDMTSGHIAQYDPVGTGGEFYSAFVNHATGELVVQNGSEWYVYSVPAPGAIALAPLAFAIIGRRRHES